MLELFFRRSISMAVLGWSLLGGPISHAQSEPAVLAPPGTAIAPIASPTLLQMPAPEAVLPEVIEAVPEPVFTWYEPNYWFGPAPWDIGFELGLNGAEGINQALSMRVGGHIKRETERWKFDTSLVYNKNSANDVETQNNALLDLRIDRLLGDSRWTLFFINQELYDEFQAFDLRVSLNSGLGYQLLDTEIVDLLTRFGAGASREFGGPEDRWAQEALFGLDYEHQITPSQRLTAKVDYYPEWKDFERYRVVADLGWEIDLDQPKNLSLKFSILDRYDSTPNGVDPNELNYAVLLIWGL
ncbi:MAG: DUF481 domain-containing protein [Planctomycetes bacterium]|nr:DUF481 domain-containing protein [Planctomycetota bacterium]